MENTPVTSKASKEGNGNRAKSSGETIARDMSVYWCKIAVRAAIARNWDLNSLADRHCELWIAVGHDFDKIDD